jgi:hypothetical protein
MYLQSAGVLMKSLMESDSSELTAYLDGLMTGGEFKLPTMNLNSVEYLVKCYQLRARFCLKSVADKLQGLVGSGKKQTEAFNLLSVQLVNVAKAHIMQHIVTSFAHVISQLECSSELRQVLTNLCLLYALHGINENLADFIMSCNFTPTVAADCFTAEMSQLEALRHDALGLVDAYDYRDEAMQSCLGAYDGNVYERLFQYVKNAPLNQTEVHEPTYAMLKPYLHTGRDLLDSESKL